MTKELCDIEDWNLIRISAIDKLASSGFYGHHMISIENYYVADCLLSKGVGFSAVTKAVLDNCRSKFAFYGGLKNLPGSRYVVTSDSLGFGPLKYPNQMVLESVGFLSLEPSTIIAENVTDSAIFDVAGQHYAQYKKYKGINVRCTPRGGGGNGIKVEFNMIVQAGRELCLAITDGDQNWPGRPESDVSKGCSKIAAMNPVYCEHFRLPVRELENLIPISAAYEIGANHNLELIEKVLERAPQVRMHGDLKDGVDFKKIYKMKKNGSERLFLEDVHRRTSLPVRVCEECSAGDGEKCECVLIPNFKAGISVEFKDWLLSQSRHKSFERFGGEWRDDWLKVGEVVFNFCCAMPQIRV
ncbi:hypothetical protein NK214_11875 [Chromobacterium sp. S0633]|uniref:hypothetical protein n=1 Tax=Chromobacterium sp. S0633 TaxID=2957805 RepID=UPI00209CB970|nr:hypothetical protein [Chromobacterium sp. S0633]MCP1290888.1 hypothetical protein [Chromobacterium sp. S0633]